MGGPRLWQIAVVVAVATVLEVTSATTSADAAAPPPEPYGAHDAGGFLSVLPPGEAGTDNAAQLARFELDGTLPEHWADQQPLYEGLLQGAQGLTDAQIPRYFKDATFGVPAGDVESTISPRPGVTIVRDAAYGVPHVYGVTHANVMFGAGYAGAQDRLFLMDVLRHAGRAQLSSFIGGAPSNREMDRYVWSQAPYTNHDLAQQISQARTQYGAAGRRVLRDGRAYTAGVNAYIQKALTDPALLPAEYAAIGKLPSPWTLSDSIAEADLIGLQQGQAGGGELGSAAALQALDKRFGRRHGHRAWRDFREQNDPEAATTVRRRFPYQDGNPFARRGLAMPDAGSVKPAPVGPPLSKDLRTSAASAQGPGLAESIGLGLLHWLRGGAPDSNVLLVPTRESTTGGPVAVMGPQVDYYVPEILMEEDLHGPGVDARGAAFPGVNQYVQLGHGRDYAWSATSAESDNVDTFAEVLCRDRFHYRYRGRCMPMQKLSRHNAWTPNGADQTPPGSETLTAYRTVHGIVEARGTVGGRRVAFVRDRSTYFHEADSAIGFRRLNNPHYLTGPKRFARAVSKVNFLFNWFYVDRKHIAYQQSGWYPKRSPKTSPDFPILGTGRFDWRGFHPATHTADFLDRAAHPHATDPRMLVSWNNKPAPGWSAPDDNYAWGPVFRSMMLSEKVRQAIRGPRRASPADLVRAMEESATQDLRAHELIPLLLRALGHGHGLDSAKRRLRAWWQSGAHRRDLNGDGHDEHTQAIELWDAWWPRLVRAEFKPSLGANAFDAVQKVIGIGTHVSGDSFFGGWWGFVSKDLRDLFDRRPPRGSFSRIYCGGGSRPLCRKRMRASLRAAIAIKPAELYGGVCPSDPEPACADRNQWNVTAAIDMPPFPFQNRPTFQQVATPGARLP